MLRNSGTIEHLKECLILALLTSEGLEPACHDVISLGMYSMSVASQAAVQCTQTPGCYTTNVTLQENNPFCANLTRPELF